MDPVIEVFSSEWICSKLFWAFLPLAGEADLGRAETRLQQMQIQIQIHCAPPWFLRVLGGCGFKFWWQPHILLRLTPDKRIYNFWIPRTTPTHGLKKWLFDGVCEVRKGPPLWKWSKIDQLFIFLAKWWIFLEPKVLHPLPHSKWGIVKKNWRVYMHIHARIRKYVTGGAHCAPPHPE